MEAHLWAGNVPLRPMRRVQEDHQMKDEALKLALEALEQYASNRMGSDFGRKAITAIKQALAAPVQEPVAWISHNAGLYHFKPDESLDPLPLYLAPPAAKRQWVGLTDEEFEDIELGCRSTPFGKIEAMKKVEAKLKEKNT
jgi:hypothetical protein